MGGTATIRFTTTLLQNDPRLGLWLRIPARFIRAWGVTATTTVEGTINGIPLGRRAIKDSGPKTDDWYMALTKPISDALGGRPGDEVTLEIWLSDMSMPAEMSERMANDADYASAWDALGLNHQRKAIEHYLEAKTPAGRSARLEKIARSIKQRLAR